MIHSGTLVSKPSGLGCEYHRRLKSLPARIIFAAILLTVVGAPLHSTDSSSQFAATEKDFSRYFPAYLANGYFSTTTALRGTEPANAYRVGVMDYTPGDVSRPVAIPSWAELDYFDGNSWLNACPVNAQFFAEYRQTLQMYGGTLSTQ
jgi:hypothetical protein